MLESYNLFKLKIKHSRYKKSNDCIIQFIKAIYRINIRLQTAILNTMFHIFSSLNTV